MAIDLSVERDLTFIFERDDVKEAFAGHCAKTHDDLDMVKTCPYCSGLRLILADAIIEWLALVDQDRASRAPTGGTLAKAKGQENGETFDESRSPDGDGQPQSAGVAVGEAGRLPDKAQAVHVGRPMGASRAEGKSAAAGSEPADSQPTIEATAPSSGGRARPRRGGTEMRGRYCQMCDHWWALRITKPCPACGFDTIKGDIPDGEPPDDLRYCICADPENCRETIPGYVCRKGHVTPSAGAAPTPEQEP